MERKEIISEISKKANEIKELAKQLGKTGHAILIVGDEQSCIKLLGGSGRDIIGSLVFTFGENHDFAHMSNDAFHIAEKTGMLNEKDKS